MITHSHPPDRVGVRWLLPGLKVYYIPFPTIASSATLPNYFTFLPYFRVIIAREHIHLVHAHASLSSLGQEAILHAHYLGVRTVFTDHSLFGFEDAASILTNKLLAAALKNVDAVICVSHTGWVVPLTIVLICIFISPCEPHTFRRENTVLRGQLFEKSEDSSALVVRPNVYVIPNALVAEQFTPATEPVSSETRESPASVSDSGSITKILFFFPVYIVVLSRLAYRKGIDLLVATAPRICSAFPNVKFIVGKDDSSQGTISYQPKPNFAWLRGRRTQAERLITSARTTSSTRPHRAPRSSPAS